MNVDRQMSQADRALARAVAQANAELASRAGQSVRSRSASRSMWRSFIWWVVGFALAASLPFLAHTLSAPRMLKACVAESAGTDLAIAQCLDDLGFPCSYSEGDYVHHARAAC